MAGLFLHLAQRALGSPDVPRTVVAPVLSLAEPDVAGPAPAAPRAVSRNVLPASSRREARDAKADELPAAPVPAQFPDVEPARAMNSPAADAKISLPAATAREPAHPARAPDPVAAAAATPRDDSPPRERPPRAQAREARETRTPPSPPGERLAVPRRAHETRPMPRERAERDSAITNVIEVSIDRIDVHQPAPARAPAQAQAPASRRISLGDYLGGKHRN